MDGPPRSARETRIIEANAVALGVPVETLMENAGRAVAEEAAARAGPGGRVAVVAGTGNNGGDGLATAFYLAQWGHPVDVWLLGSPAEIRTPSARRCYDRLAARQPVHEGVPSADALRGHLLVVDAMLGTGQHGDLRSPYLEGSRAVNASGVPVLSIDEPTGVGHADAVRPRWTVALEFVKTDMTEATCGEIVVRPIGIPAAADQETGPGVFLLYPTPPVRGRLARTGRVMVVGGGPYAGAPALAGLAVLRSGAERAIVVAPSPAADRIQEFSPNLIVRAVGTGRFGPDDVATLVRLVGELHADALVVGMGVGDAAESAAAARELLRWAAAQSVPLVIDADALGGWEAPPAGAPAAPRVATPNRHEFDRHFGPAPAGPAEQRVDRVAAAARERALTILAKDDLDVVSDGARTYRNRHHHPAMTVGGVGDVLAGVVGSLLARDVGAVDAARLAAYWVGEAGLRAFEERSWGLVATDVIEALPRSLHDGLARVGR